MTLEQQKKGEKDKQVHFHRVTPPPPSPTELLLKKIETSTDQQIRVYPYPLVAGSARPNPKMGAPDPKKPLFLGFSVLRGARAWGRGRSGDCEPRIRKWPVVTQDNTKRNNIYKYGQTPPNGAGKKAKMKMIDSTTCA